MIGGESGSERYICLVESKGRSPIVGYCIFEVGQSECRVGQINDDLNYTKALRVVFLAEPSKIILPKSSKSTPLFSIIRENFPLTELLSDLEPCNLQQGELVIKEYCSDHSSSMILEHLTNQYYSMVAISGLFYHITAVMKHQIPQRSLLFIIYNPSESIQIDYATIRNIELIKLGNRDGDEISNVKCSLMEVIDRTVSAGGKRKLREAVLSPLIDIHQINERQQIVEFFIKNRELTCQIREKIKNTGDVFKCLSSLKRPIKKLHDIRGIVSLAKALHGILLILKIGIDLANLLNLSPLSDSIKSDITSGLQSTETEELIDLLRESLNENLVENKTISDYQACFLVKNGKLGILDVARRTLYEQTNDILEYTEALSKTLGIDLKVKFINSNRYCLLSSAPELLSDKNFTRLSSGSYTTLSLMKANERVRESMEESITLSFQILDDLAERVLKHYGSLAFLAETLAKLDLFCSFATFAEGNQFIFPIFSGEDLHLQDVVHPFIYEKYPEATSITTRIDELSRFVVISGNNMSGKTTFCKTIAVNQVMAQMGMPIRASHAQLPIFSKILTRLGSDDDPESNSSTFTIEMREAAAILANADRTSLILIDELGRGSSINEGLALAAAISEKLIESKAIVYFVTHFGRLSAYLETFPFVQRYHLTVQDGGKREMMIGSPKSGDCSGALELLHQLEFPSEIIERTLECLRLLRDGDGMDFMSKQIAHEADKRRRILKAAYSIGKIIEASGDIAIAVKVANELQTWLDT